MFQKINQIWVRGFLNCIGITFYLLYLNDNVAHILYKMARNDPLLLEAFTLRYGVFIVGGSKIHYWWREIAETRMWLKLRLLKVSEECVQTDQDMIEPSTI